MKKNKIITLAVSFLLTVGMIGAGFAAWVISAPTEKSVEGTVTVDTVTDKRIKLSNPVTTLAGVTFGADTVGSTGNGGWLIADAATEDLTCEFSFNIENQQKLFEAGVRQITLTFALNTTNLASYATDEYITIPSVAKVTIGTGSETENTTFTVDIENKNEAIPVTVKYTFGWGNKFGVNNPYTYFAGKNPNAPIAEGSETVWADQAFTMLEKVAEMNEKKFSVTVTATVVEPTL